MKRDIAELLIKELGKHNLGSSFVKRYGEDLVNLLVSIETRPSTRFYEEIPANEFSWRDTSHDASHELSLTRILRNEQAVKYEISWLKSLYEAFLSSMNFVPFINVYDSDALTRRIRADKNVVQMMRESSHEHSLLGKIKTKGDYSGKVTIFPILLIPDAKYPEEIRDWERANITGREMFNGIRITNYIRTRMEYYLKHILS